MTSRQRMLAAMHHEKVDRVPVSPFGLGHLNPKGEMAAELIEKTDPFITAYAGGNPLLGADPAITVTNEGNDTITVYHTPRGNLKRIYSRTAITSYTTEFPCKTIADVEAFMSMPWRLPAIDPVPYLNAKASIGENGLVLANFLDAICLPFDILSPENACMLWAEAPTFMQDVVAEAARRIYLFVESALALGVDAWRIVGGEYATEMLGPRGFAALIAPHDTKLVDLIHRHNGIAYYHNHGDVDSFLEPLADLGIDYLDPLEVPPYGNVDIGNAVCRIGSRVCLVGGLDDMEVLEVRPTEEVLALARETLRHTGNKNYILGGTASGTYTEKAARNFIALVAIAEAFAD